MQTTSFRYRRSSRVCYRSCVLDSLTELRFVLSIEQDFYFLREHVRIWYHSKTLEPTYYLNDQTKLYTPDFLIRGKENNTAYLVEIKPRAFQNAEQLTIHSRVAERFIDKNKYDWKFIILFNDEISLNKEQQKKFNLLKNHKQDFSAILKFHQLDRKYNNAPMKYSHSVPSSDELSRADYVRWVMCGDTSGGFS